MKFLRLLIVFAMIASPVFACINVVGTKYNGDRGDDHEGMFTDIAYELRRSLGTSLPRRGASMEASLRDAEDFKDRNDYAVALMYRGRNDEAVKLLTELEAEQPGQYYVAANLGTAYELAGNDSEALRWVNEGIRRNPKAHRGTEWLHAKILEIKLAAAKSPVYFQHHSVLDQQPETVGAGIKVGDRLLSPGAVTGALYYQLEERMKFVKPTDPIVAGLLYDFAVLEAVTSSMEAAKHLLKLAEEYGYPAAKVAALERDFNRRLASHRFNKYWSIGLVVAAVITGGWAFLYACKRTIRACLRSSEDLKET
jgi:tetratricopeptide (TPR) repeat protein